MMSEGGDPLSLPFTSKIEQSPSVAQTDRRDFIYFIFFFFTSLASKERAYFCIL